MTPYIIRRFLQSIAIVIVVSIIIFAGMRYLPGDPALMYLNQDDFFSATPAQIAKIRHEYGLDKPIPVQYMNWVNDVLHGDLGRSIMFQTSVNEELANSLPKSLQLGSVAFCLSIILGLPLGIVAAIRRGKWPDTVTTLIANIGITAPIFWVGIVLVLIFGLYLGWLPIFGYTSPFVNLKQSILQSIMPIACLTVWPMASIARQTRSAMLEVIRQDYIRTAWAKGLTERQIITGHATRNAIIPIITLIGMNVRQIFGGQVLVETVFNIAGMGRLAVSALHNKDYAIVQGIILVISIVVVCSNLLVDLSYGWIDPRVRQE